MNVRVSLDQAALADYIRQFVVKLRQSAVSALGRSVTITMDQSGDSWTIKLTAGTLTAIVPIGGLIPVLRQNQMGEVTNPASGMQERLLQDIVKKTTAELWPMYVKRVVKIHAG